MTNGDLVRTLIRAVDAADHGAIAALTAADYRRLDGRELNLPCCNVFGVHSGVVNDYRIYMDVHPVLAP